MEKFFPELLDCFPREDFLREICKKYHYEELRIKELRAVAEEMRPLMHRDACWETCSPWVWDGEAEGDTAYEGVVMTLGKALDCLQEDYHERGMLTESYMLEVLASELLLCGYRAYNRRVREKGKGHVARYHFPGSEESFPLEMLPRMLSRFSLQVSCNEAFCMLPKKSVAFLAELTRDERIVCGGICMGCGSINCPNRVEKDARTERMLMMNPPLTYGYQKIFGNKYK